MTKIRESMGVCQQFDVLIDELTVRDHMTYALGLKNIAPSDLNYNLDECLTVVGLSKVD